MRLLHKIYIATVEINGAIHLFDIISQLVQKDLLALDLVTLFYKSIFVD